MLHRSALHPAANEEWFQKLPHERRARMNREWRAGLAHTRALGGGERKRLLAGAARMAALYAIANGFCPGDGGWTYVAAFLVGGVLGLVLEHVHVARLLSGVLGLLVFFLYQWLSRDGLSALHLFVILPVGAISAHLGANRELE